MAYNYYFYYHNAMALKGGLKQTFKRKHAEAKNESKREKGNFEIKERDWRAYLFGRE